MRIRQFDFLDLPVYRIAKDRYYTERDAHIDSVMTEHPLPITPQNPSKANLSGPDALMRDHLQQTYGGPWRYNEVIGHLRLHILGSQIRAEYWCIAAKRIVRTRRKIFFPRDLKLVPEQELPIYGSSENIYQAILAHVERCKKKLKDRYVDTETLTALGPFIDWHALVHGP